MTISFHIRLASAHQAERSSFDANDERRWPQAFPRTGSVQHAPYDVTRLPLLIQRPACARFRESLKTGRSFPGTNAPVDHRDGFSRRVGGFRSANHRLQGCSHRTAISDRRWSATSARPRSRPKSGALQATHPLPSPSANCRRFGISHLDWPPCSTNSRQLFGRLRGLNGGSKRSGNCQATV